MITIYKVENDTKNIIEYGNINGHIPVIRFWMEMENKYLPPIEIGSRITTGIYDSKKSKVQEIWDLVDDKRLTIEERMIMASTFDFMIVKKEYIPYMIAVYCSQSSIEEMKEIAFVIDRLYREENCYGYGIIWSSVTDYYAPSYDDNEEEKYPNVNEAIEGYDRKCSLLFTEGHFEELLDEYKNK